MNVRKPFAALALAASLILALPLVPAGIHGPTGFSAQAKQKDPKADNGSQVIIIRGKGGTVTDVNKHPRPRDNGQKQ